MPGRTLEESNEIRRLVKAALESGINTPRAVKEYIKKNSAIEVPSIPTITAVMKDLGYTLRKAVWEKAAGRK